MIARRSLCPEKLGSNPGQGSKGINFSGWHGLDMSDTTVRNTLREIELQNDYCNGCGLTDHGCGMTLLSNELQIRTIGSIPGITGHN